VDAIRDGERIEIDLAVGEIRCAGGVFITPPLPGAVMAIFEAGGLIPYTRARLEARNGD
jgi:3-isopropylmalate/(R)-2-methylmalate dehydratase small subunit